MGIIDKLRRRKSKVAEDHGDQIADGVDKATDIADDKTGGQHTDQLDEADEKADELRDQDQG